MAGMKSARVPASRVLLVAAFGAFLAFLDATIVNVAFPSIRASFPGTSIGGLSWVLNAYNIVFAAFLVAAGRMADLLGRKRLFEAGVVIFTVMSVLCALAPSVEALVAARILHPVDARPHRQGLRRVVLEGAADLVRAQPGDRRLQEGPGGPAQGQPRADRHARLRRVRRVRRVAGRQHQGR